jgi:hypothetical protein
MGNHKRNTGPMLASKRCLAQTRSGGLCNAPAVGGRSRCRMHGGARGSGAPQGNQNALKHGVYTQEARARRGRIRLLVKSTRELIDELS